MGAGCQRWWRDVAAERVAEFERFDAKYRGGVVDDLTDAGYRRILYADGSMVIYRLGSVCYSDGI